MPSWQLRHNLLEPVGWPILASSDELCVAVACDMPFLNTNLLQYMTELSPKFDAVIPRVAGEIEPLHAIYSQKCIDAIELMMREDDLKVRGLLDRVRVRYVEEEEVNRFDPDRLSWFNINTPADLKKASEIMNREREEAHK